MQKMPKARIKYAARVVGCAAKGGVAVDVVMINLEVDQFDIDYKLKRTARRIDRSKAQSIQHAVV
jgi:hypothetical protein